MARDREKTKEKVSRAILPAILSGFCLLLISGFFTTFIQLKTDVEVLKKDIVEIKTNDLPDIKTAIDRLHNNIFKANFKQVLANEK